MKTTLQRLMHEATRLTRSGRLGDATQALQRALRGLSNWGSAHPAPAAATVIDGCVSGRNPAPTHPAKNTAVPTADPGQFSSASHSHGGLTRAYKLYTPTGAAGRRLPLLVMLHGCTQNPDDFAAGTGMNELAIEQGFYVLYPAQAADANPQRCWNWFKHSHQQRGRGEAGWIAHLTQALMAQHNIDPGRVWIAGLSAGGAMAANVAAAYPEVYAAVGVHSGLAAGATSSLPEALAAMRGAAGPVAPDSNQAAVPTIIFHGDQDGTVHPRNGEQVLAAALAGALPQAQPRVQREQGAGSRRHTRSVHHNAQGQALAEHWLIHGAGHAWSGGRPQGSYTDASGPDASREMLRFFQSLTPPGRA